MRAAKVTHCHGGPTSSRRSVPARPPAALPVPTRRMDRRTSRATGKLVLIFDRKSLGSFGPYHVVAVYSPLTARHALDDPGQLLDLRRGDGPAQLRHAPALAPGDGFGLGHGRRAEVQPDPGMRESPIWSQDCDESATRNSPPWLPTPSAQLPPTPPRKQRTRETQPKSPLLAQTPTPTL